MFDLYTENVWCLQGEYLMYKGRTFDVYRENVLCIKGERLMYKGEGLMYTGKMFVV